MNLIKTPMALAIALVSTTPVTLAQDTSFTLEEVVVTATRRTTSVQDIPYNISALSGRTLKDSGATSLNDLTQLVPGLIAVDQGNDASVSNNLIMRGVNANNVGNQNILPGQIEPSVSTYLNDTPVYLSLRMADVERVEVLRGPQGTLYGSGSVGGTIRFIFNKPSLEESMLTVDSGLSSSSESDDLSYNVDVVGNVPISDNLALRVATGYEDKAGSVDYTDITTYATDGSVLGTVVDSTREVEDADSAETQYARVALLWDVNDDVEAVLSHHWQKNESDADSQVNLLDYEDRTNSNAVLGAGDFEANITSLEVKADLGFAELTSSTSVTNTELTARYNNPLYNVYFYGYAQIADTVTEGETESFTQEFRLVSQNDGPLSYIAGFYYNDFDTEMTINDWLGGIQGDFDTYNAYFQDRKTSFKDMAVFGEVSYQFTDEFQLTLGARAFDQEFTSNQYINFFAFSATLDDEFGNIGFNFAGDTGGFEKRTQDVSDQIFKVNMSYDLSEEHMLYFTWSEGFRHGGTNALPAGFVSDPSDLEYQSDEASNWEIGVKGTLGEGSMRYTATAFRIDWEKMQYDTFVGPALLPAVINGGDAVSEGIELEITAQLSEFLQVTTGYTFTDAEATEDAGPIMDGDTLPGISDHTFSVNLDYSQALGNNSELHYNFNGSYRSDFKTNFNNGMDDFGELSGFDIYNASLTWSQDKLTIGAFVRNLTDEEGLSGQVTRYGPGGFGGVAELDQAFLVPSRTIGLRVGYLFD